MIRDLAEWLLNNKEDLIAEINKQFQSSKQLYSPQLLDIYEESVLNLLRQELYQTFLLTPEDLLLQINREYIILLLGKEILEPQG